MPINSTTSSSASNNLRESMEASTIAQNNLSSHIIEDHFSASSAKASLTAKAVLIDSPVIIADHFTVENSSLIKETALQAKKTALQAYLKMSKAVAKHAEQMKLIRPDSQEYRDAENFHDQLLSKLEIAQNKLFSLYQGEEAELTSILETPVIKKMTALKEYLKMLKIVARHSEKMKLMNKSNSITLQNDTKNLHYELIGQLATAKSKLYSLYEGDEAELLSVLKSAFKEKI
jgi:hypothetical protein